MTHNSPPERPPEETVEDADDRWFSIPTQKKREAAILLRQGKAPKEEPAVEPQEPETTPKQETKTPPKEDPAVASQTPPPEETKESQDLPPTPKKLQLTTRRGALATILIAVVGGAATINEITGVGIREIINHLSSLDEFDAKKTIKYILEARERLLKELQGLNESFWKNTDLATIASLPEDEDQANLLNDYSKQHGFTSIESTSNEQTKDLQEVRVELVKKDTIYVVTWNLTNKSFRIDERLDDMVRSYVKSESEDGGEAHEFQTYDKNGKTQTSAKLFRIDENRRFIQVENENNPTQPKVLKNIDFKEFADFLK